MGEMLLPDLFESLDRLIDCARRNFDSDRSAAKASLARASSILQSELERKASGADERAPKGALAGWQIRRLKDHVDANLERPIPVRDLADVAQRSPDYFCRAFKRTFGESPHAFIVGRRLDRAIELMLGTDDPLAQIALSCGFGDQAHLCRAFRARYGRTPAAWRRQRCDLSRNDAAANDTGAAIVVAAAKRRAG